MAEHNHHNYSRPTTTVRRRRVAGGFGRTDPCDPLDPPPLAKEGDIHWSWCPSYSWVVLAWIGLIVVFIVALLLMILAGAAGIAFGVLLLLVDIVALWGLLNWRWNDQKRFAYRLARLKRQQAVALFARMHPTQLFRAKDVFFSTKYGGKTLVVLRDGTMECYGSHKDEMWEELMGGGGEGHGGEGGGNENEEFHDEKVFLEDTTAEEEGDDDHDEESDKEESDEDDEDDDDEEDDEDEEDNHVFVDLEENSNNHGRRPQVG